MSKNFIFQEMTLKSGQRKLIVISMNNQKPVAVFLISDLQKMNPIEVISLIDKILNGELEQEELHGNVCNLQIKKNVTKVCNHLSDYDDNKCEIDTKELRNLINEWHCKSNNHNFEENLTQDLEESINSEEDKEIKLSSISDLKNVENFRQGALEHIFIGQLNHKNRAEGYHYEGFPNAKGKVIDGTRTPTNKYGAYTAKVEVEGILKHSYSTFYPKKYTPQDVVDIINYAYHNMVKVTGTNVFKGEAEDGMVVELFISETSNKIISAFPNY